MNFALPILLSLSLLGSSNAGVKEDPIPFRIDVSVNIHQNFEHLEHVVHMGAKWVRIDTAWMNIQPDARTWNFDSLDRSIEAAERERLKINLILSGTPSWASTSGLHNGVPSTAAWTAFVAKLVERYGARIGLWAIWNEPNLAEFWTGSVADYFRILKEAHPIIKSKLPNAVIGGPELALLYKGTIPPDRFLKDLHKLGGEKYIDVVTHHVYGSDLATMKKLIHGFKILGIVYKPGLKQILERSGFKKPMWITEFGWDALRVGEEAQASNLVEALKLFNKEPWIEHATVYTLTDDPRYLDQFLWGMVRIDRTPRPAVAKIRELTR